MIELPEWPISDSREIALLQEVLRSPQWGGFHPLVGNFEDAFSEYQGARFGVSAVNGTVTLEMMLACGGIRPGDEVIVPAISFVSTASAVTRVGAVPVFVDIEPYSFNICPDAVRAAITRKTAAVMAVHFGGSMAEIDALMAICDERELLFFEDAAHAHGSEWNGRRAGSFGWASSFSFQNGKVMTAGEGGMAVTSDEELAGRMRSFANQGRRPGFSFFHHFEAGNNYRMSALHAAVLMAQLERLDAQIALRTANWSIFLEEYGSAPGITWQSVPKAVNRNSRYLILGRVANGRRDSFCSRVQAEGIPCTPFYPHPLYGNPMYASGDWPCRVMPCPNAEACIGDAFWIGFRALMGDEETTRAVARALAENG
ncbi:MAG: DegT/DnrJ/EryC1/StrS family aminotransferase [Bryobacteraceae bacterium]